MRGQSLLFQVVILVPSSNRMISHHCADTKHALAFINHVNTYLLNSLFTYKNKSVGIR